MRIIKENISGVELFDYQIKGAKLIDTTFDVVFWNQVRGMSSHPLAYHPKRNTLASFPMLIQAEAWRDRADMYKIAKKLGYGNIPEQSSGPAISREELEIVQTRRYSRISCEAGG